MKRQIRANDEYYQRVGSTSNFDVAVVAEGDELAVKLTDLNGNYTILYPEDIQELIDLLMKAAGQIELGL